MIRFEDVRSGSFEGLAFAFQAGLSYRVLFGSEADKNAFLGVMLGEKEPDSGRIFLFGEELFLLEEERRLKLLSRIGLVPARGGVVSNLKVWENIVLPSWYHRGLGPAEAEFKVREVYQKLGFDLGSLGPYMSRPTGALPIYEMKIVCLVRAMLMEPEVMIYDTLFDGLRREDSARLLDLTEAFHGARRERLSVHLSPDAQALEGVRTDRGFQQQGKELVAWPS